MRTITGSVWVGFVKGLSAEITIASWRKLDKLSF